MVILIAFVIIETRVAHPLLPLRVVLNRNRGGAYAAIGLAGASMFGIFLFLTYFMTGFLGFSAIQTGAAFLPMLAAVMTSATTAGSILTPRIGPRPLVPLGGLIAAGGMAYLSRLDVDSTYAGGVLPGLLIIGLGMGMIFAPVQNAATSGVEARDAGVASAMINTMQQIGGSIGAALLSSIFASASTNYLTGKTAHRPDPGAGGAARLPHRVLVVVRPVRDVCRRVGPAVPDRPAHHGRGRPARHGALTFAERNGPGRGRDHSR